MKDVMTAYKYYHQSIQATMKSRMKKAGKEYVAKPFTPGLWTTDKKKAAINAYQKHVDYLKRKRAEKNKEPEYKVCTECKNDFLSDDIIDLCPECETDYMNECRSAEEKMGLLDYDNLEEGGEE